MLNYLTFFTVAGLLLIPVAGFSRTQSEHVVAAETLVKTTTSWDGALLPAYPNGQPQITVLRITIPGYARLPMHKHPVINVGYMLSGSLIVTDEDGNVTRINAGEPLVELVDKWHYGENPLAEPAVIVVVYAGVIDVPVTVAKP